jgi:hypothetical protein
MPRRLLREGEDGVQRLSLGIPNVYSHYWRLELPARPARMTYEDNLQPP